MHNQKVVVRTPRRVIRGHDGDGSDGFGFDPEWAAQQLAAMDGPDGFGFDLDDEPDDTEPYILGGPGSDGLGADPAWYDDTEPEGDLVEGEIITDPDLPHWRGRVPSADVSAQVRRSIRLARWAPRRRSLQSIRPPRASRRAHARRRRRSPISRRAAARAPGEGGEPSEPPRHDVALAAAPRAERR